MTRPSPFRADATAPLLAGLAVLVLAAPLGAQSLEDRLRTLGAENARRYSHPVSAGLAAGLASGWHHSAETMDVLGVELSLQAMGAVVPEEDESFRPALPSSITVPELDGRTFSNPYGTSTMVRTPTAAGEGVGSAIGPQGEFQQALVDEGLDPSDFLLRFPDGFDIPAVPLAVIQGSVGLPAGTEVTGRLIPGIEVDEDVGSLSSVGVGVKHSISQWIPGRIPVDLAVEGGVQSFEAGDYLEAYSRHVALVVSRKIGVLTLYGSGGLEESDVDVSYTLDNPVPGEDDVQVTFSDQGDNTSRFTAGFNLDLLFLQLNAGYTLAEYHVLNASVGLTF